jgi:hypothetical protein
VFKYEVSKPFSVPLFMEDVARVLQDHVARGLEDAFEEAVDAYKDRVEASIALMSKEDQELVALMGGYSEGIFLERTTEGDDLVLSLKVPDARIAKLLEYGAPGVPASRPLFFSKKELLRLVDRIWRNSTRRVTRLSKSASSQTNS